MSTEQPPPLKRQKLCDDCPEVKEWAEVEPFDSHGGHALPKKLQHMAVKEVLSRASCIYAIWRFPVDDALHEPIYALTWSDTKKALIDACIEVEGVRHMIQTPYNGGLPRTWVDKVRFIREELKAKFIKWQHPSRLIIGKWSEFNPARLDWGFTACLMQMYTDKQKQKEKPTTAQTG